MATCHQQQTDINHTYKAEIFVLKHKAQHVTSVCEQYKTNLERATARFKYDERNWRKKEDEYQAKILQLDAKNKKQERDLDEYEQRLQCEKELVQITQQEAMSLDKQLRRVRAAKKEADLTIKYLSQELTQRNEVHEQNQSLRQQLTQKDAQIAELQQMSIYKPPVHLPPETKRIPRFATRTTSCSSNLADDLEANSNSNSKSDSDDRDEMDPIREMELKLSELQETVKQQEEEINRLKQEMACNAHSGGRSRGNSAWSWTSSIDSDIDPHSFGIGIPDFQPSRTRSDSNSRSTHSLRKRISGLVVRFKARNDGNANNEHMYRNEIASNQRVQNNFPRVTLLPVHDEYQEGQMEEDDIENDAADHSHHTKQCQLEESVKQQEEVSSEQIMMTRLQQDVEVDSNSLAGGRSRGNSAYSNGSRSTVDRDFDFRSLDTGLKASNESNINSERRYEDQHRTQNNLPRVTNLTVRDELEEDEAVDEIGNAAQRTKRKFSIKNIFRLKSRKK